MSLGNFAFSKQWTNSSDFSTYEASEAQVRADLQCLFDEIKAYINTDLPGEIQTLVNQITIAGLQASTTELNQLAGAGCVKVDFQYLHNLKNSGASYNDVSILTGAYSEGVTPASVKKLKDLTYSLSGLNDLTATASELNAVHESSVTKDDLVKLHAITATAAEINKIADVPATGDSLYSRGLLDLIYPVGSYYMSSSSSSPAVLFGGGTWTQVKDKFILAAGDSYSAGATGGAAEVTLTSEQSGQKAVSITEGGAHTHTGTAASAGAHTHQRKLYDYRDSGGNYTVSSGHTMVFDWCTTGSAGAHTHTVDIDSGGAHSHSIAGSDAAEAHNNMPPYLVAYVWQRTA